MNKMIMYIIISLVWALFSDGTERISKCDTPMIGSLVIGITWPVTIPMQIMSMNVNNKFINWCVK